MEIKWRKYSSLEPVRRLRNEGRELLGNRVIFTVKRDGENVSRWVGEDGVHRISSRNQETASSDIQSRMKFVPEYKKTIALLDNEYNEGLILYGELLKTQSPTGAEPRRKNIHWILFDVWDMKDERYIGYNKLYQLAYQYKIPVVPIMDEIIPMSMTELFACIDKAKTWCRRHRREGVVLKDYSNQNFAKEKIDISKRKRLDRKNQNQSHYPPMPEEKIIRALQHAYDEIGAENWKNVKIAMPCVAKHISTEAKEHNYNVPKSMYNYYVNTPLATITGEKDD